MAKTTQTVHMTIPTRFDGKTEFHPMGAHITYRNWVDAIVHIEDTGDPDANQAFADNVARAYFNKHMPTGWCSTTYDGPAWDRSVERHYPDGLGGEIHIHHVAEETVG